MNRKRILTASPVAAALALAFLTLAAPAGAADSDVSKVNGSINVDDGERAGKLSTVNGSIHIGSNARVGGAGTVNGSIRIGDSTQTGELGTVNGSIRSGRGLTANGNVNTVNGSVFVGRGGNVRGNVETVNGSIGLVDTDLSGGIETVNGDVTVGVGSHVQGGIHYEKPQKQWVRFGERRIPRVVIGPNARVDGPLTFEHEVVLYVHSTARTGAITGAKAIGFDTPTPPEK